MSDKSTSVQYDLEAKIPMIVIDDDFQVEMSVLKYRVMSAQIASRTVGVTKRGKQRKVQNISRTVKKGEAFARHSCFLSNFILYGLGTKKAVLDISPVKSAVPGPSSGAKV